MVDRAVPVGSDIERGYVAVRLPGGFREREWSMRALRGGDVGGGRGVGVYELCRWAVLRRDGREQRERVHELQRGDVLERDGRDLVRRVRGVRGGGVFGDVWREQCEYVCAMPRRDVLDRNRSERVCIMPDRVLVLDSRIHIHHKLRLQRRVLRAERWHVYEM